MFNLEKEIDGVPPHNVWNYDETNLVDDPGNKKVITRRGAKYPEQIQNASKACTSIMVCGNAAGDLVPLYVNYKAEKLWTTWTENGPDGARYNRTKSGWFDHQVFEDWIISLMLPILKRQEGTKVVIGDNLSSHISLEVLRLCEENSIKFIALPPNATHLLQPLDVAFFRPLKSHWREVLTNWKKTPSGSRCSTIPKDEFPRLLKQLLTAMEWGTRQNLRSGFRKTGIVPLNKQQVLSRLPSKVLEQSLASMTTCIGDTFLDELKRRREEATKPHENKRRKKVNVPPGKSIGTSDVLDETNASAGIKKTMQKAPQLSRKQRKRSSEETEEESDDSDAFSLQDSDRSVNFDEELSDESENSLKLLLPETSSAHLENIDFRVGEYVVVNYEGTLFPGRVTETKSNGYMVTVMERTKKQWKWPTKPDEILYSKEEVLYSIYPPKQISSRGLFQVSGLH